MRRGILLLILWLTLATGAQAALHSASLAPSPPFFLHDGDTVLFYGDSITEQMMYGRDIETYVHQRFPHMHIKFINSGWSGDKVIGGAGGDIELRLKRDVLNYKPTVVTIFLGMNDGLYKPYNDATFQTYTSGVTHIVEELTQALPGVRLTLLTPSMFDYAKARLILPFDPATDYNQTLLKFGDFLKTLGQQYHIPVADVNAPMVAAVAEGRKTDPNFVLSGDGIHPNEVGHAIIAAAVLQAWNTPPPPRVLAKVLSLGKPLIVTDFSGEKRGAMAAQSLGPIVWPVPDAARQAFTVSPLARAYAQSFLKITGTDLKNGASYSLSEDGQAIGVFTPEQLAAGIDLLSFPTLPQNRQAQAVLALVQQRTGQWHEFWKGSTGIAKPTDQPTEDELAQLRTKNTTLDELQAQTQAAAQPAVHAFTLTPAVPSGQ